MDELQYYSANYEEARLLFRQLATQKDGELYALPVDEKNGLFVDIALWKNSADKLLIHCSGIHGVEAFSGSAVQCAFIDTWNKESIHLPTVALIHCANPYGMRHLRRWNAENIDLNRNFLTFSNAPLNNRLYNRISDFLNPRSQTQLSNFPFQVLKLLIRYRFARLQQAIAQGQYTYPQGLFFGGKNLAKETELLQSFFQQHLAGFNFVQGIDFHTGLGKYARSSFYIESNQEHLRQRAEFVFGQVVILANANKKQSYQTLGSFVDYLKQVYSSKDTLFVTQEIGTVGAIKILRALREENYYYHNKPHLRQNAARHLKESFSPNDKMWRASAVKQGVKALLRLIEAASS